MQAEKVTKMFLISNGHKEWCTKSAYCTFCCCHFSLP